MVRNGVDLRTDAGDDLASCVHTSLFERMFAPQPTLAMLDILLITDNQGISHKSVW